MLMGYEVTRDMPLKEVEITTPVAVAKTKVISGKKLALVPILRAGLGMVDGMLKLIPAAKVGHIGLYRDPQTLNRWNTIAKCRQTLRSGTLSCWILCWQQAAAPSRQWIF